MNENQGITPKKQKGCVFWSLFSSKCTLYFQQKYKNEKVCIYNTCMAFSFYLLWFHC
uniref:Uncharacterized protein n=1 Tax=Anguilla anguilla TaxID=7936 RepID=A0A0E9XR22_ANGAN